MNLIKTAKIIFKMFKKDKAFWVAIGYLLLGYFRWQPWIEADSTIWQQLFSWSSWVITILPVFLFMMERYMNWMQAPSVYLAARKDRDYGEMIKYGIFGFSLIVTSFYVLCAGGWNQIFFRQDLGKQMIEIFHYGIPAWILLNICGTMFGILKTMGFRVQIAWLFSIGIPVLDYGFSFYGGWKLGFCQMFFETNIKIYMLNLVFAGILYLMLNSALGIAIDRMELTGECDERN